MHLTSSRPKNTHPTMGPSMRRMLHLLYPRTSNGSCDANFKSMDLRVVALSTHAVNSMACPPPRHRTIHRSMVCIFDAIHAPFIHHCTMIAPPPSIPNARIIFAWHCIDARRRGTTPRRNPLLSAQHYASIASLALAHRVEFVSSPRATNGTRVVPLGIQPCMFLGLSWLATLSSTTTSVVVVEWMQIHFCHPG